jgi:indole-3-glycerol phosphate synthase
VRVAESGIGSAQDVKPLADAGFDAVLVGESLVRSADPEQAVRSLRLPARIAR